MALPLLSGKGRHRGLFPGAETHRLLEDQITAGLQARCAEEAELLAARIRSSPIRQGISPGIAVRRLTVFEYEAITRDAEVYDSNVSVVLVLPKPEDPLYPGTTEKTKMLLYRSIDSEHSPVPRLSRLPKPRIPLFFAPNFINDSSIRARLRTALNQALDAERSALQKARSHIPELQTFADQPYVPKASTTYALCASRRADVVPLAIALWRLKMWEGL
ncbi:hypothetical protein RhiJN_00594 [Ceratobasidium sp. AG-Ba]|nr:hypothetical protein RhiJN_00594 [Ceratobasidium sp. AG-Ba]QRW01622.1 hypothetical protein RhiLY_00619 [Ceratobasidium sp. AG-Ba]